MSTELETPRSLSGSVSRRSVLAGIGTGALGLAGAALLGCSGEGGGSAATGGGGAVAQEAANLGGSALNGLLLVAPVAQGKPRQGGAFNDRITATYVNNDMSTAVNFSIWHIIGDKSVNWDAKTGKLLPQVVTSWEAADPLNIVLKLTPNSYMHNKAPWNGRQFTADDLAWNLERNAGFFADRLNIPKSLFARSTFFTNMTKAEAVDPLTVRVKLSAPNSGFFNAALGHSRMQLMPKEMDDIGYSDPLKMGGNGPFQVTEWLKDQRSTYKKFENYSKFRPNEPHFDTFNHLVIADPSAQQAAFLTGQIQVYTPAGPTDIPLVQKAKPDALLYQWTPNVLSFVRPGFQKYAPFKDARVRQAVHLSLDYAAMADGAYGPGWVYQAVLNPALPQAWRPDKVKTQPGWSPTTKTADRAEGAKMLAAAGYPNGKGIDFKTVFYAPGTTPDYLVRFQGQLTSLYPDMKITFDPQPDNATFGKRTNTGDFDALVYGHDQTQDPMFAAYSEHRTGGNRNEGQFSDPACDALLDKMVSELNQNRLNDLLEEFQGKWATDWHSNWIIPAGISSNFVQPDIGGYDTTAGPLNAADYSFNTKVGRWFYLDR